MKILLINYKDAGGGAATAALRLTEALNAAGVYARLGVCEIKSVSPYVFQLPKKKRTLQQKIWGRVKRYTEKIFNPIIKLCKPKFYTTNGILHSDNFYSETDVDWINNSEFDVVNLHWINGVICNKDIAKITKPIVWTMHDSWPCCGAEHHPNIFETDRRWIDGYTKANKPLSTQGYDYCKKVWSQKRKYLLDKQISFIAPSRWEHDVLKASYLFKNRECTVIPNIIPQTVFFKRDKKSVRELFNIPKNKIVLGFGAAYDIDNPKSMKGSFYLIEFLNKIVNKDKYFIVVFGPTGKAFTSKIVIPFFEAGYISNSQILASLYSCCDVIINPSLIENLPTTCLESISCGVPVIAFDVGGTSDIVVHKETGYLAKPYSTDEMIEGLKYCIKNSDVLTENCLKKMKKDFSVKVIVKEHVKVFEKSVDSKKC